MPSIIEARFCHRRRPTQSGTGLAGRSAARWKHSRGEGQRGFLAMQVGKLPLEHHVIVVGTRDIARAPEPAPASVDRFCIIRSPWVLAHAEIVVGAPHGDRLRGFTF